jgi:hypothetical protein
VTVTAGNATVTDRDLALPLDKNRLDKTRQDPPVVPQGGDAPHALEEPSNGGDLISLAQELAAEGNPFAQSVVDRAAQGRKPTPNQLAALRKIRDQRAERDEPREAEILPLPGLGKGKPDMTPWTPPPLPKPPPILPDFVLRAVGGRS